MTKLKYPAAILSDNELSFFLMYSTKNIAFKNYNPKTDLKIFFGVLLAKTLCLSSILFAISSETILACFFVGFVLSFSSTCFFHPVFNFLYFYIKNKKHKPFIKFSGFDIFSFVHNNDALKFDKKYNFKKIKRALDNHDFQSPDLSLYLKENFDFTQDDLSALSHAKVTDLYNKIKSDKDVCKRLVDAIKEKKTIRKVDAMNLLQYFDLNVKKMDDNPLRSILLDFEKNNPQNISEQLDFEINLGLKKEISQK